MMLTWKKCLGVVLLRLIALIVATSSPKCETTCERGQYCVANDCLPCPVGQFQEEPVHSDRACKTCAAKPMLNYVVKKECTQSNDREWGCDVGYVEKQLTVGRYMCSKIPEEKATTQEPSVTFSTVNEAKLAQRDSTDSSQFPIYGIVLIVIVALAVIISIIVGIWYLKRKKVRTKTNNENNCKNEQIETKERSTDPLLNDEEKRQSSVYIVLEGEKEYEISDSTESGDQVSDLSLGYKGESIHSNGYGNLQSNSLERSQDHKTASTGEVKDSNKGRKKSLMLLGKMLYKEIAKHEEFLRHLSYKNYDIQNYKKVYTEEDFIQYFVDYVESQTEVDHKESIRESLKSINEIDSIVRLERYICEYLGDFHIENRNFLKPQSAHDFYLLASIIVDEVNDIERLLFSLPVTDNFSIRSTLIKEKRKRRDHSNLSYTDTLEHWRTNCQHLDHIGELQEKIKECGHAGLLEEEKYQRRRECYLQNIKNEPRDETHSLALNVA